MISVCPIDWYDHFSSQSPIFVLLRESLGDDIRFIDDIRRADVILIGPYGTRHRHIDVTSNGTAWKLFVTGENVAPDFRYYHHSLSFCRFTFDGRNFRWPVWYQSLSIAGFDSGTFTPTESDTIISTNRPLYLPESKKQWNRIVAVFNNCEPIRCEVFSKLDHMELIDGVGQPFFNSLSWGDESTYKAKISLIKNYGFNLCLENALSDGYYTEKVLHARVCGCVPIIYAEPHIGMDFFSDSCINLYNYSSIEEFCDTIQMISADYDLWLRMSSGPIFTNQPSRIDVLNFLSSAYGEFVTGGVNVRESRFDHMREVISPESMSTRLRKKIYRVFRRG